MHRKFRSAATAILFTMVIVFCAGPVLAQSYKFIPEPGTGNTARTGTPGSAGADTPKPVVYRSRDLQYDRVTPFMEREYVIGPGDVLEVLVWREENLSRTNRLVLPDGTFDLPLINSVHAGGKTVMELKADIEKALTQFVDAPRVYITVKEPKSYSFNILGNVTAPGRYQMESPTTVLQAIAIAKGFNEWASEDDTIIIRGFEKEQIVMPFDYSEVIKGKAKDQNVILRPGDTIVVP